MITNLTLSMSSLSLVSLLIFCTWFSVPLFHMCAHTHACTHTHTHTHTRTHTKIPPFRKKKISPHFLHTHTHTYKGKKGERNIKKLKKKHHSLQFFSSWTVGLSLQCCPHPHPGAHLDCPGCHWQQVWLQPA